MKSSIKVPNELTIHLLGIGGEVVVFELLRREEAGVWVQENLGAELGPWCYLVKTVISIPDHRLQSIPKDLLEHLHRAIPN